MRNADTLPKYMVAEPAALILEMPWNAVMDLLARPEVTVVQLLVAACLETAENKHCLRRI